MIDRLNKLLTVKSIVTILLTVVFAYLCVAQVEVSDTFKTIYTMIVGFYFGTQAKREGES